MARIFVRRDRKAFLRDYSRKQFNNPMFRRRQEHRGASMLRFWLKTAAILAVVGFAAWAVVWSPFLAVNDVSVSGNQHIPNDELRSAVLSLMGQKRWKIFPQSNILFLSQDAMAQQLTDRFVLASVDIVKRPPHRLEIKVTERVSSIELHLNNGSRALLDLDGNVIRLTPSGGQDASASGTVSYVLIDDKDEQVQLRERVAASETVQAVIAAAGTVHDVFAGTAEIAEIHIEGKTSHTLRLLTGEGWSIYVDASEPLKPQITNAQTVIKTKVPDTKKLDYVDVRFNEKVFFKLKS